MKHRRTAAGAVDFGTDAGRARYWSCQRKTGYPSERKAMGVAADSIAAADGIALRTYRCAECKKWHLTKAKTHPRRL